MKSRTFNCIARPTDYEVAKALADRDDMLKPFQPIEIPELRYPEVKMTPTSLAAFFRQWLP